MTHVVWPERRDQSSYKIVLNSVFHVLTSRYISLGTLGVVAIGVFTMALEHDVGSEFLLIPLGIALCSLIIDVVRHPDPNSMVARKRCVTVESETLSQ